MFYDYIYLDMDRISAYGTKLGMKKPNLSQMTEKTTNNREKQCIEGESVGKQEILKEYMNFETDETYFEEFEQKLETVKGKGLFFDISDDSNEKADFINLNKRSILKFEAKLLIPEEFGQADFIKTVLQNPYGKSALLGSIEDNDMPKEFLNDLINEDRNIPIYFEVGDYKLYSTIKGKNFCNIGYSDFEENVGDEVTIVAKVEKVDNVSRNIMIYDVYKDLLNMNRAMRRSMEESNSGGFTEKITIEGKSVKLVILAIYK